MEFVKVIKNETKEYSGKVYDLNIYGEDHTYKIEDYVVHNSAGGCMCLCALGIVGWKADALQANLLFERFISAQRLLDHITNYYVE
jgi:hypothetical protein